MTRLVLSFWLAASLVAQAATYYVDFDGGNNALAGTSSGTAWKHCPGDPNATGTAASTTLAAGDTVIFKGGVVYRSHVFLSWSGSDGNPITYDGNSAGTFGTGMAIMDGSDVISTSWTNCVDAADCGGNPNWANIYYTPIPAVATNGWRQILIDGTNMTRTAQEPDPSNPFLWDDTSEYFAAHHTNVTSTNLVGTNYFTQASSSDWDGAWIAMRGSGNALFFREITAFDPATDMVTFPSFSDYTSQDTLWAVFNHIRLLDQPGEHVVDEIAGRLYIWPHDSGDMGGHTWSIATRTNAFGGLSKNNLTFRNFLARGYYYEIGGNNDGACIVYCVNTGTPGNGAARNNSLYHSVAEFMRSMPRRSLVTMNNDYGITVQSNVLRKSYAGGIRAGYGQHTIVSNWIEEITGTGVFVQYSTNSTINWNTVTNLVGTHANGISVYTYSDNVEVNYNRVVNANNLITFEYSQNVDFIGNLVDARGKDQRINEWGVMSGTVRWLGNTLVNNSVNRILNIGVASSTNATYTLQNNIIDGGGVFPLTGATHTYNIYTGFHFWQDAGDLSTGESEQDEGDLFVSFGNDYRLIAGSPAIDAGTDLSGDYTVTLDGQAITGTYDIGAFGTQSASGGGVRAVVAPGGPRRFGGGF